MTREEAVTTLAVMACNAYGDKKRALVWAISLIGAWVGLRDGIEAIEVQFEHTTDDGTDVDVSGLWEDLKSAILTTIKETNREAELFLEEVMPLEDAVEQIGSDTFDHEAFKQLMRELIYGEEETDDQQGSDRTAEEDAGAEH